MANKSLLIFQQSEREEAGGELESYRTRGPPTNPIVEKEGERVLFHLSPLYLRLLRGKYIGLGSCKWCTSVCCSPDRGEEGRQRRTDRHINSPPFERVGIAWYVELRGADSKLPSISPFFSPPLKYCSSRKKRETRPYFPRKYTLLGNKKWEH